MDCIVNAAEDWGIGLGDRLLVSLSADLRRFRALTLGKTVILGRKTLATFPGGRPLKNRVNWVLSANTALSVPGAAVFHSPEDLLARCRGADPASLCVIGGASVYRLLLPYCRRALVTRTFLRLPADRFFPDLDALPQWTPVRSSEILEENGVRFQYLDYENRRPLPLPEPAAGRGDPTP